MRKDIYSHFHAVAAISPAVKTDAENGAAIDVKGYSSAQVIVHTGAIAGAGDFSFKLQESDTSVSEDFDDVAAADQKGTIPATMAATSVYRVGYIGKKRYIRVVTIDNGGTSVVIGATALLGNPHLGPVA